MYVQDGFLLEGVYLHCPLGRAGASWGGGSSSGKIVHIMSLPAKTQRLCLPSSLSSAEPKLDVNDEVEALAIPLATSSAVLALLEASLVTSLTLSLAESIVVLIDSMFATIILIAILVSVTMLSAIVATVLVYASASVAGKFAYGNQTFIILLIMGVHAD